MISGTTSAASPTDRHPPRLTDQMRLATTNPVTNTQNHDQGTEPVVTTV